MTEPLSPAAQAVLDAAHHAANEVIFNGIGDESPAPMCVAAAFRALAVRINGADDIRQDVLDIATELEDL